MKTIKLLLLSVMFVSGVVGSYAQTDTAFLVKGGASSYKIIYGKAGGTVAQNAATEFQKAIKSVTGVTIATATDDTQASTYEIILGPSNTRVECTKLNEKVKAVGKYGYRISIVGKKVVITASDNNHMVLALKRFEEVILQDADSRNIAGSGFLYLPPIATQVADFSHTQATLRNIVAYNIDHSIGQTLCVNVPKKDGYYISQGVCTDGTYVYFVIKKSESSAKIYKYRMSDWKYVSETANFNGGHCNDLYYDWPNHRIINLRGGTDSSLADKTNAIDPVTMAVTTGPTISGGATAMDYNRKLGLYINRNGKSLIQRNADLTTYKTGSRGDELSMTTQGMGTDDDYFYFPNSPKNGESYNMLAAYQWSDCKWKKNIKIPVSWESESMFEWDGIYYVTYFRSNNGAYLYKLDITLTYTAGV